MKKFILIGCISSISLLGLTEIVTAAPTTSTTGGQVTISRQRALPTKKPRASTTIISTPITPAIVTPAKNYKECTFISTAYYSPLPGQKYYLRGNYDAEVILNGGGIRGASGKKVFTGMLAAPKGYDFNTKIWIEGFGVGSVEDRGGAIVKEGVRGNAFDRIDIWMGSGDEGLARALSWGKRTVKARIYDSKDIATTFDLSKVPLAKLSSSTARPATVLAVTSKSATGSTSKSPSSALVSKNTTQIASETLDELDVKMQAFNKEKVRVEKILEQAGTPKVGDTSPAIRMIQEVLIKLGYLKTKSTAIYGPATQDAIAAFQKSTGLVMDSKDPNSGILGKVTRAKLAEEILYHGVEIGE